MSQPSRAFLRDLARNLTLAALFALSIWMLGAGLMDNFQFGNGDYEHWREYVGKPLISHGALAVLLTLLAAVVARRRSRVRVIVAVAAGVSAALVAGLGLLTSHERSAPENSFRAALARLDLGSDFTPSGVSITNAGGRYSFTAPAATKTWLVDRASADVCNLLVHRAEQWAGSPIQRLYSETGWQPPFDPDTGTCGFVIRYHGRYLVSFGPQYLANRYVAKAAGRSAAEPWTLLVNLQPFP